MAACYTPFMVTRSDGIVVPVPCGKCPACLKRRASHWSFRLQKEAERATSAHWITLTYSNSHVPITQRGYMTLDVRSFQLFMKRLRKANKGVRLRYYAAGEYGSKTWRPHWHCTLFNAELKTIQPAWNLGEVWFGSVEGASIGYTLKYMMKPPRIPVHRNDDRVKERSLMSKGLGSNYLTDTVIRYHKADLTRCYITLPGGVKCSLPRYLREKIYDEYEREQIAAYVAASAGELTEKRMRELQQEYGDAWYRVAAERARVSLTNMYSNALSGRDKI